MTNDTYVAGDLITTDGIDILDELGRYTPIMSILDTGTERTTTFVDFGDSGTRDGFWHRCDTRIYGCATFHFSGTGIDTGDGLFQVQLPFPALVGTQRFTSSMRGSPLGIGFVRDNSNSSNNFMTETFPSIGSRWILIGGSVIGDNSYLDSTTISWTSGDWISVSFAYDANPEFLI